MLPFVLKEWWKGFCKNQRSPSRDVSVSVGTCQTLPAFWLLASQNEKRPTACMNCELSACLIALWPFRTVKDKPSDDLRYVFWVLKNSSIRLDCRGTIHAPGLPFAKEAQFAATGTSGRPCAGINFALEDPKIGWGVMMQSRVFKLEVTVHLFISVLCRTQRHHFDESSALKNHDSRDLAHKTQIGVWSGFLCLRFCCCASIAPQRKDMDLRRSESWKFRWQNGVLLHWGCDGFLFFLGGGMKRQRVFQDLNVASLQPAPCKVN